MFSEDIDDEVITAEEFSAMSPLYNSAMTKLEEVNNNNNDKIIDDGINDGKNFKGLGDNKIASVHGGVSSSNTSG